MRKGMFLTTPLNDEKITHLIDLGINEISLGWHNYTQEHVLKLRELGIKVFAEISLFVGEELWKRYPDARPVDRDGKPMEPIHWYHGVCPNHPGVRKEKLEEIEDIISKLDVDGLWLDFIRYPCHWEEVRTIPIMEYCYCEHCLTKFAQDVGGKPEGTAWLDWKCNQITGFVQEVHARIQKHKKPIELGLFAVPWSSPDYDGAIKGIIGQDFERLSAYVDVFGVMAYHKITGQPSRWINDIVYAIAQDTNKTVMPLVQSIPIPEAVSPEDFASSIKYGMRYPSNGVMVFHYEDMVKDKEKVRLIKQAFQQD